MTLKLGAWGNKTEVMDLFTDVMQYEHFFCFFDINKKNLCRSVCYAEYSKYVKFHKPMKMWDLKLAIVCPRGKFFLFQ